MAPLVVVELLKAKKLALQVASSPKGHDVEILSPDSPDESLDERMRNRQVGHSLYFGYLEYSKVSLPLMKSEQRFMIAADVFWRVGTTDRTVEHPAERWSIDGPCEYAKANDSTCVLIHNDEHPMALENEGFTTEQIDAPQAVLCTTEYCQLGRPVRAGIGTIATCQHAPYYVPINLDAEDQTKLLCDSAAAPARITFLGFNNGRDEFR